MTSIRAQQLLVLLTMLFGGAVANTFHFEIENDTIDCDDPTTFEAHLKSFNLQCLDGFGCERGAGILAAGAHVAEHAIPTSVHIVVEGCHVFDQFCPEDVFDGFIDICDDVGGIALENKEFCSEFEEEGRFGVGIPFPHNLNPIAAFVDVEEVVVEFTFDDLNFCSAKFHVTLEDGLVSDILGFGAPLLGIGVSFLAGAAFIARYFKNKQEVHLAVEEQENDPMQHKIPAGIKTTPAIATIGGRGGNHDEFAASATYRRMLDYAPQAVPHAAQMELVQQAHFERLKKAREAHFEVLKKTRESRRAQMTKNII